MLPKYIIVESVFSSLLGDISCQISDARPVCTVCASSFLYGPSVRYLILEIVMCGACAKQGTAHIRKGNTPSL